MNEEELRVHRELEALRVAAQPRSKQQRKRLSIRMSKLEDSQKGTHMADAKNKSSTETVEYDWKEAILRETENGTTTLSDATVAALRADLLGSKRNKAKAIVGDVLTEPTAEMLRAGIKNPAEAPTEMRAKTLSGTGYRKSNAANEDDPKGSQAVDDDDAANFGPEPPKGQYSGQ